MLADDKECWCPVREKRIVYVSPTSAQSQARESQTNHSGDTLVQGYLKVTITEISGPSSERKLKHSLGMYRTRVFVLTYMKQAD